MDNRNNMNLIMEGWRRFLNEDTAQLDRIEDIAAARGIGGGSYSYENGRLNGVKLNKDEIRYIKKGGSAPRATKGKSRSEISKRLYDRAKKEKNPRLAIMSWSLVIFADLNPVRDVSDGIKKLMVAIQRYLKHPRTNLAPEKQSRILALINKAIDDKMPSGQAEEIKGILGVKY